MKFIEKDETLKKLDELIREPIFDRDVFYYNRGVSDSINAIDSITVSAIEEYYENGYNAGWEAGRKRLIEQIEEKAGIIRKERKRK